jgi:hypothetical protein
MGLKYARPLTGLAISIQKGFGTSLSRPVERETFASYLSTLHMPEALVE